MEETFHIGRDEYCIHGHWEDGICVCEPGYRTTFVEISLDPRYCATDITVVIGNDPYSSENLIHWSAMAVSLLVISVTHFSTASVLY